MIACTGVHRMHEQHARMSKQMKSTLISVAMNAAFLQAMLLPF